MRADEFEYVSDAVRMSQYHQVDVCVGGVVYVITGLHKIEYLQRIYRHIIPLLKTFGKSNFQNKSSSWNIVCSSLESVESPLSIH